MNLAASTTPSAVELEAADVPAVNDPDAILLRALDWRVTPGETWLVAGPPGCGKTSVLLVAAGLVPPAGGRHRLFGVDVGSLSEPERIACRSRVGLVFGGGGRLFPQETVAGNLTLPLSYHGRLRAPEIHARLAEVLAALALEPQAGRRAGELPRRIAQRVALARALVLGPELLFLDDPLSGQPPDEADWWIEFAGRCRGAAGGPASLPRTLVVCTSDPRPWRGVVDRFAAIIDGRWQEGSEMEGAPEGLRPPAGA